MSYLLTEENELMRQTVREFAEKELAPRAKEMDETGEFPYDLVKRAAELNLCGVTVPEEYGGAGSSKLDYTIAVEEIARANATMAIILAPHNSLGCTLIKDFGTEEQKQKFLIPAAKGEKLTAFAITEPAGGSDPASGTTTAVLDGDSYIVNGTKCFITNCGPAELYMILAKTESDGKKGFTAFIVEKGTPGFKIGKLEDKMGVHASATGELIFENCRVPKENVLGEVGKGFKVAMVGLDQGRISIAAMALGIAQASLEASIEFSKQRKQFGKPICSFQAISFYMADMATQIEAARSLIYRAASLCDAGEPFGKEAAMAKFYAAEVAMWCSTKAVQIHGGYGYSRDFPVERYMREAKICEIAEGTTEIQKLVLTRHLLS